MKTVSFRMDQADEDDMRRQAELTDIDVSEYIRNSVKLMNRILKIKNPEKLMNKINRYLNKKEKLS
jgi:hypothetical protein